MVLCWIALPVFLVLSIFSVKYRRLTKESFECLWRTATLRPCQSSLDQTLRADITARLMKRSPSIARLFYHNYKLLAFIVLVLMIVSTYFTALGIYNYIHYGNCNGAQSTAFCIIDAALGKPAQSSLLPLNTTECMNQTNQTFRGV